RAKRRPEAVHLAERRRGRLHIELACLRQIRRAQVEVFRGEQVAGRLTDRPGEDRRVDQDEMPLVEEVADRLDHLVADPRDRDLAPAAEPEMAVLEQDRKSTRLNSSHRTISYAVFCLKKKI